MIVYKEIVMVVGGRNNLQQSLPTDILNLKHLKWSKIPGINRFRHGSWINSGVLYNYGGFESSMPDAPTDKLQKSNIMELLSPLDSLKQQLFDSSKSKELQLSKSLHMSNFNKYNLNENVVVVQLESRNRPKIINLYPLNSLHKESEKINSKLNQRPVIKTCRLARSRMISKKTCVVQFSANY